MTTTHTTGRIATYDLANGETLIHEHLPRIEHIESQRRRWLDQIAELIEDGAKPAHIAKAQARLAEAEAELAEVTA